MTVEEELVLLRAENEELRRQVAELQSQIAELKAELAKGRGDPPSFVRANRPKREGPKPARKKRDAQHNRVRRREAPTQTILHAYDRCPDCNYRLSGEIVDRVRQVIELPEPRPVEVIEHRLIKRYCPACGCFKAPPLDLEGQVLGRGRMGVRLTSLVVYLRITERLPIRLIQSYLETIHRLKISIGEIVYLLDQVREKTKSAVEGLRDEARKSKVLHADETGWRVDGQNGYIWAFSTPGSGDGRDAIRYYERDQSRGQAVVRRVLGNQFKGHLVSDFYVGYNDYESKKQRCWSHLLRDLHDLKEAHKGEEHQEATDLETVRWAQAVRALYDEAEAFLITEPKPSQEEREKKYVSLVERVHALGLEHAQAQDKGHPTHTLCKRLLLHEDELFQFVLVEGLSSNNNLAERSIRPMVVIRKISGGSRSNSGSKTTMALASLLETWRARGLNPFAECLKLLSQKPDQAPLPSPA